MRWRGKHRISQRLVPLVAAVVVLFPGTEEDQTDKAYDRTQRLIAFAKHFSLMRELPSDSFDEAIEKHTINTIQIRRSRPPTRCPRIRHQSPISQEIPPNSP